MEAIVFVEYSRIRTLGGAPTFVVRDGVASWSARIGSPYRFLVVDGTLVVVAAGSHAHVYAMYMTREMPLDEAAVCAKEISGRKMGIRIPSISGAGIVDADGQVIGWETKCYDFVTPTLARDGIQDAIEELFREGTLAVR